MTGSKTSPRVNTSASSCRINSPTLSWRWLGAERALPMMPLLMMKALILVIAGLDPAIQGRNSVIGALDARVKRGHDGLGHAAGNRPPLKACA
jgi:hypothetical protein